MPRKKYFTEEERIAARKERSAAAWLRKKSDPEAHAKYLEKESIRPKRMRDGWERKHGIKFASELEFQIFRALALYPYTVCAVTGMTNEEHMAKHGKRLALDHDHETGAPRRFLAGQVNRLLGYLENLSPEQADKLIALYKEGREHQ